ncbi:MAG: hypothetical protein AABY22_23715 [Nanoarchaeota archaeon]
MSKIKLHFIDGTTKIEDIEIVKNLSLKEMQEKYKGKSILRVDFIENGS